jgi:hypothetical protein
MLFDIKDPFKNCHKIGIFEIIGVFSLVILIDGFYDPFCGIVIRKVYEAC